MEESVQAARNSYYYTTGQSTKNWRWIGIYATYEYGQFPDVLVGQERSPKDANEMSRMLNSARPFEHMLLESLKSTLQVN